MAASDGHLGKLTVACVCVNRGRALRGAGRPVGGLLLWSCRDMVVTRMRLVMSRERGRGPRGWAESWPPEGRELPGAARAGWERGALRQKYGVQSRQEQGGSCFCLGQGIRNKKINFKKNF